MVYSKYGIIILSHFATIRLLHNFAYKRSVVSTRAFVDIFILFIINPITSGSNIIQGEFTCFNSEEICTHARIPAVLTVYNTYRNIYTYMYVYEDSKNDILTNNLRLYLKYSI